MSAPETKMRPEEIDIDAALVGRLLAAQFPRWAGLPLAKVRSAGTDNAMYRLGDELVVRLPRLPWGARQVGKELRWLPHLAPRLPLEVPVPVGRGEPGEGYGLPWSVLRWLDGDNAHDAPPADQAATARQLGAFVVSLRRIDATGGPASFRGGPVAANDEGVRAAIGDLAVGDAEFGDLGVDAGAATALWEEVVRLPQWAGPPVWVHSDLLPGNLLVRDGRLSAVIDFGGLGVGDPACDLLSAWTVLSPGSRGIFRDAAAVDDATWARGRGWALAFGLMADHYYRVRNPVLAGVGRRAVAHALADHRAAG